MTPQFSLSPNACSVICILKALSSNALGIDEKREASLSENQDTLLTTKTCLVSHITSQCASQRGKLNYSYDSLQ